MRPWRVKDANSKPIEVVTFGDVDAEKHRDSEDEILSRFEFELVIWPQEVTLVRTLSHPTLGSVVPLAMFFVIAN